MNRLASFGLEVDQHYFFCIGGFEDSDHLFINCLYSRYILLLLAAHFDITSVGNAWLDVLTSWGEITNVGYRSLALTALEVFAYHVWRERNSRLHNKGVLSPNKLLMGILVDI